MDKPDTRHGYGADRTENCERLLVTLLRGLGPWKRSVYLIGGLTPRYLVRAKPPEVPPHAGTLDVDIVLELKLLTETEAYRTLEQNLKNLGFERASNDEGKRLSWRWLARTESGEILVLEFLADSPSVGGGSLQPLPTKGNVSALNIPHASIVFDLHEEISIEAELLGNNGIATERVRHANVVSFTILKALAFEQRAERKDAFDLIYCLENAPGGMPGIVRAFAEARAGTHREVIDHALAILSKRFTDSEDSRGYRRDGPVAVAKFELGEDADQQEPRTLRQRHVNDFVATFLSQLTPTE